MRGRRQARGGIGITNLDIGRQPAAFSFCGSSTGTPYENIRHAGKSASERNPRAWLFAVAESGVHRYSIVVLDDFAHRRAAIVGLLFGRGPAAIHWFVIAIVIDSVERFFLGSFAHISKEIEESAFT